MKKKSIITLCFVVLIAVILNVIAFYGFNISGFKYGGIFDEDKGIRKGIDLAGGSVITFQANATNIKSFSSQLLIAWSIFEKNGADKISPINTHIYHICAPVSPLTNSLIANLMNSRGVITKLWLCIFQALSINDIII